MQVGKSELTVMSGTTHMSEKGRVVIPKATRDRLCLVKGERFEIVERPDGVLLRVQPKTKKSDFDEITARIRARVNFRGSPVPIAEMSASMDEMFRVDPQYDPE